MKKYLSIIAIFLTVLAKAQTGDVSILRHSIPFKVFDTINCPMGYIITLDTSMKITLTRPEEYTFHPIGLIKGFDTTILITLDENTGTITLYRNQWKR